MLSADNVSTDSAQTAARGFHGRNYASDGQDRSGSLHRVQPRAGRVPGRRGGSPEQRRHGLRGAARRPPGRHRGPLRGDGFGHRPGEQPRKRGYHLSGAAPRHPRRGTAPAATAAPTAAPSTAAPTQAPVTTAPTAVPGNGTYTVQLGDTLASIGRKFGITAAAIQAANGISNADFIWVGQTLVIPGAGAASPRRRLRRSRAPSRRPPLRPPRSL